MMGIGKGDEAALAYLREIVARVIVPYRAFPQTQAILSMGSIAYETVDRYSDVDLAFYYDELPTEEALASARRANGAEDVVWAFGDRAEGTWIEAYLVGGVECQLAHSTIEAWEGSMATVLESHDVDTPLQKALSGILEGVPLYGEGLIERFKARASDYPDALAVAMVRKHLTLPPLWRYAERLRTRDALLWQRQSIVEGVQGLLGLLAGLNRLYYTSFQFKRMEAFVASMRLRPERLYERLTALLAGPADEVEDYRRLVEETVALIAVHLPEVDLSPLHASLARREVPWVIPAGVRP